MALAETGQWFADTSRLLKISLRNHDTVSLDLVYQRIANRYGPIVAENAILQTITHLMETENWSWEDDEGNPSPLLGHEFPIID